MRPESNGHQPYNDARYSHAYLRKLFDVLADNSYELVSTFSSLGLIELWRRNSVRALGLASGMVVGDLMGGAGESWKHILPSIYPHGHVFSIDFSQGMVNGAQRRFKRNGHSNISVVMGDATALPLEDGSLDAIFSGYGVKTLCTELHDPFVEEIKRVLKQGGRFAMVEVTIPSSRVLQSLQRFYMLQMMPLAFAPFAGNYDRFLMINKYLLDFGSGSNLAEAFNRVGFAEVQTLPMSGGLATVITGTKA